ncbi:MAG: thiamine pyridinylase [Hyphomicrobiales bacterium]
MKLFARACALALLLVLFAPPQRALAQNCGTPCTDGEQCIAAGLYPYVPDIDAFASSICSAWAAAGQTEKLYLITDGNVWDGGYSSDPVYTNGSGTQAPIDVFVFDAMYLDYWKTQTTPVPASSISDASDFVEYAQKALTRNDGSMFALPMLGCTNIMFYRDGDTDMDGVSTLPEFLSVNPAGVYISPVPFDRTGAMLNISGKTTIAVDYMVKGLLDNGAWPSMNPLDQSIVDALARLSESASWYNALTGAIPSLPGVEDQYVRAGYFSEGYGRTSIGFSESMSQMSDATRGMLKLRAFPWSKDTGVPNMFYADVVGVNSNSTFLAGGGTLPFTLANLMTQQTVVQNAIAPPSGDLSYLFPARTSILDALSAQDPLYAQMKAVLTGNDAILVNMPTTDRDAFHTFGGTVETAVRGAFSGSCDLESTTFPGSDAEAPAICNPLCASSGGWIGSWTNRSPPAWPGYSACGCAQCTADTPLPAGADEPSAMITSGPELRRYHRN